MSERASKNVTETPIVVRKSRGRPPKNRKAEEISVQPVKNPAAVAALEDRRIEKEAKLAASKALADFDFEDDDSEEIDPVEQDLQTVDTDFSESQPSDVETDVFRASYTKALLKNDFPVFYIYKNAVFSGTRNYPYSWDKLQTEFGEGHFRVLAKGKKAGHILATQIELVGNPMDQNGSPILTKVPTEPLPQPAANDPFMMFNMMDRANEKAEAKAASAAHAQSSIMAQTMQMVAQQQSQTTQMMLQMFQQQQQVAQQAQQQFQMMMMEQQNQRAKQDENHMKMIVTLMTREQPKADSISSFEVIKLTQEAESRGEQRANRFHDLAEDKAESLAEDRIAAHEAGNSGKEESLTSSIIKGLMPMAAEVIKNPSLMNPQAGAPQGQPGQMAPPPTPEQIQAMQVEEQRREIVRQAQRSDRIEKAKAKKMIAGAANGAATGSATATSDIKGPQAPQAPQDLRKKVVDFIGRADQTGPGVVDLIKYALANGKSPIETAEAVLKRLEICNLPRHTVREHLSLEDIYKLALANGLPRAMLPMAEPWIAEFYGAIFTDRVANDPTQPASPPPAPSPTHNGATTRSATASSGTAGSNTASVVTGNGSPITVATSDTTNGSTYNGSTPTGNGSAEPAQNT